MRDRPERARGVTLKKMDLSWVDREATEQMRDPEPGERMEHSWDPWAVAIVGEAIFVVNVEGVGYEVDDDTPLSLDLYRRSDKGFGIMPSMEASLSRADVLRMYEESDEEIDLADLVRQFGQRLEDNFWLWHRMLSVRPEVSR